jgi:hypothetical protein
MIPCCRLAIAKTASNPMEWDYYGKIGTWSRFFNWLWSKTGAILVQIHFLAYFVRRGSGVDITLLDGEQEAVERWRFSPRTTPRLRSWMASMQRMLRNIMM